MKSAGRTQKEDEGDDEDEDEEEFEEKAEEKSGLWEPDTYAGTSAAGVMGQACGTALPRWLYCDVNRPVLRDRGSTLWGLLLVRTTTRRTLSGAGGASLRVSSGWPRGIWNTVCWRNL